MGRRAADRRRGGVLGLAFWTYAGTALGLVTGPLSARALGPAGRGEVAGATVYGGMAALLLYLGVPGAAGWWVTKHRDSAPGVLAALIRFGALLVIPAGAVAVVVAYGPLRNFPTAARFGAAVLILIAPLGVVNEGLLAILRSREELGTLGILRVGPFVLGALATIAAWALGILTVTTAIIITIGAGLGSLVLTWVLAGIRPRGKLPLGPLLGFGVRSQLGIVAATASGQLDQALVAPFLGERQLGLYVVAVNFSLLPLGLGVALSSRAFGAVANAAPSHRGTVAARYLRLSLLAGVLTSAGSALLGPIALPILFGARFQPAVVPFLLLLPGTVATFAVATAQATLTAMGHPGRASLGQVAGTSVTVLGLALFLASFGLPAAAVITSANFIITLAVQVLFMRSLGVSGLFPRLSDISAITLLAQAAIGSHRRTGDHFRRARRGAPSPRATKLVSADTPSRRPSADT